MVTEQDQRISDAVEQERSRLGNFIRRHVPDKRDAEDVLQEVFYELVEATRNLSSIEQLGAWLFQVARNRITDLYRRKRPELKAANEFRGEDDGEMLLDSLPSPDAGPEAAYARTLLM